MPITRTNPPSVAAPVGAYTHLAVVPAGSDLLVLAGQLGVDKAGRLPDDPEAQFRNALRNALAILKDQGVGPEAVIKVNIWLVRPIERQRFQAIWEEFHGGAPPPTTLGYVAALVRPEYFVEVEVWAARPAKP